MSFFSNIFKKSRSRQEQDSTVSEDKDTSSINAQVSSNMEKEQIPPNLPEALRYIVDSRGSAFLQKDAFINMLSDIQAIKDFPPAKHVLTDMLSNGYLKRIVSISDWSLESKSICKQFVNEFATKENIVSFIIQSLGYGLKKVDVIPIYKESSQSPAQVEDLPKRHTLIPRRTQAPTVSTKPAAQTVKSSQSLLPYNPLEPYIDYEYPKYFLLNTPSFETPQIDKAYDNNLKDKVARILSLEFGIQIQEIKISYSNLVDYIECKTEPGTRFNQLKNMEDDLGFFLSPKGIRLQAPIPGTDYIGIEIPARKPYQLPFKAIIDSNTFLLSKYDLPCFWGQTPSNEIMGFDLSQQPHLLISGTSGQGKSTCIHNIIMSLLFKKHPNDLKFIFVDYKKIEFAQYSNIRCHFIATAEIDTDDPIIFNDEKAKRAFKCLKEELDARLKLISNARARNIKDYNSKFCNNRLNTRDGHKYLPYIVVIIDEYFNLVAENKSWIEPIILHVLKNGRTAGIHFIISTNRPTADIMDSSIKSEISGRIAFKVSTASDSRFIIGANGAEKLFSAGDALFADNNNYIHRVQCADVQYEEIERVCNFIEIQKGPNKPYIIEDFSSNPYSTVVFNEEDGSLDPIFAQAAAYLISMQQGSTSMIQRHFSIGYNRSVRLMSQLEKAGIVGPAQGSGPREVLIYDASSLESLLNKIRYGDIP